jgi:Zn-dependent protease
MDERDFALAPYPPPTSRVPINISPVFALIVLVTLAGGYGIYRLDANDTLTSIFLVIFVVGGWILSLCLHEFGHALVAYVGGDHGVAGKGYLTLNPLKYTHGLFSIVFPLVFLAMGGIGLPGGAVYINPGAIRSKHMRSLTSAAGPFATTVCAVVLLIPFMTGIFDTRQMDHLTFWAGLALLAFLQITALFFNLLPIPGLDGFGIIAPYLPENLVKGARSLGMLTYFIIFFLFFGGTPVSRAFWTGIFLVVRLANLDVSLIDLGLRQFQFWAN